MTNVPTWLGSLVGERTDALIEQIAPNSVLSKLLSRTSVNRKSFGAGIGAVNVPYEGDPTLPMAKDAQASGAFFAEGDPIRVGSFAIESATLTPKETGVIVPWTRKLERMSGTEIVGLVERVITRQTTARLDAVLLSATVMNAVNPQGLADPAISGFTTTAFAPAGATPTIAEIEDAIGALIDAMPTGAIDPVVIMHEKAVNKLSRYRSATGPKAFAEELMAGQFLMTPVLTHNTGPLDQVFILDAGRFVAAVGTPMFDISSEATLHMESVSHGTGTGVQPIVGATATDVAAPTRSLFQTASRGVRMILDASWTVGGNARSHQLTSFDV
jgi:HK97 family phage major capsid protein